MTFRDRHGFVLGGMEGSKYHEYDLQLTPGDKIFVYTDGVPEATNSEQKMFGTDHMLTALNRDASAAALRPVMGRAVFRFFYVSPQDTCLHHMFHRETFIETQTPLRTCFGVVFSNGTEIAHFMQKEIVFMNLQ